VTVLKTSFYIALCQSSVISALFVHKVRINVVKLFGLKALNWVRLLRVGALRVGMHCLNPSNDGGS